LFRAGADTECEVVEWDMNWTAPEDVTGGYCEVSDFCLDYGECFSSACIPGPCVPPGGPGAEGCHWDEALSGTCNDYWSASERADTPYNALYVNFNGGYVDNNVMWEDDDYVRCVR
jgi:hypothetical protein